MVVSLEKLLSLNANKYVFTKATMKAIEKIGNIKEYQKDVSENEKVVIKTLNLMLEDKIKYVYDSEGD